MKKGIHPDYGPVAFRDMTTGAMFLIRSTIPAERTKGRTVEIDGATYPLVDVDVTSDSHPFWTGRQTTLDTEGRVEAFHRRYGRKAGGR
jgi:large subunit ribosomal protein L31